MDPALLQGIQVTFRSKPVPQLEAQTCVICIVSHFPSFEKIKLYRRESARNSGHLV